MIFVTVGTHEQPFDRLLKSIDKLIDMGIIREEVIVQKGYTDYESKNYTADKLIPYDEMQNNIKKARIVITHGGPSSFVAPLAIGKIPIVVPRKKEYNEHVNNHQIDFCKEVERRMKNIIVVENFEQLQDAITNYDNKILSLCNDNQSNNERFNEKLIEKIKGLL